MAKNPLPDSDVLRQFIDYDPATGEMFWKRRLAEHFPNTKRPAKYAARAWNNKHAGNAAFRSPGTDGYLYGVVNCRSIGAHRVAIAIMTGNYPYGLVDHINGVKTDNRYENLRVVDDCGNARNSAMSRNNTSGITGVDFVKSCSLWRARIGVGNGQSVILGMYPTKEMAIIAREAAEKALGYHPNHGRPISPLSHAKPSQMERDKLQSQFNNGIPVRS